MNVDSLRYFKFPHFVGRKKFRKFKDRNMYIKGVDIRSGCPKKNIAVIENPKYTNAIFFLCKANDKFRIAFIKEFASLNIPAGSATKASMLFWEHAYHFLVEFLNEKK